MYLNKSLTNSIASNIVMLLALKTHFTSRRKKNVQYQVKNIAFNYVAAYTNC